jgi:hypothetical protein
MKTALVMCAALATTAALLGQTNTMDFEREQLGKSPSGWTATQTGTGRAIWTVEKDDTAPSKSNVLKQSGVATYPICLKDDTSVKDGSMEVTFKPLSGKEDQAGGVIWRAKERTTTTSRTRTPSRTTSRSITRLTADAPRRSERA